MTGREGPTTEEPPSVIAPAPEQPRRGILCGSCGRVIEAAALHFLLADGAVWCGACVSRPVPQLHRVTAPAVDQVRAYGNQAAIGALLGQGITHPFRPVSALVRDGSANGLLRCPGARHA